MNIEQFVYPYIVRWWEINEIWNQRRKRFGNSLWGLEFIEWLALLGVVSVYYKFMFRGDKK